MRKLFHYKSVWVRRPAIVVLVSVLAAMHLAVDVVAFFPFVAMRLIGGIIGETMDTYDRTCEAFRRLRKNARKAW